jgi:hypothetical protein
MKIVDFVLDRRANIDTPSCRKIACWLKCSKLVPYVAVQGASRFYAVDPGPPHASDLSEDVPRGSSWHCRNESYQQTAQEAVVLSLAQWCWHAQWGSWFISRAFIIRTMYSMIRPFLAKQWHELLNVVHSSSGVASSKVVVTPLTALLLCDGALQRGASDTAQIVLLKFVNHSGELPFAVNGDVLLSIGQYCCDSDHECIRTAALGALAAATANTTKCTSPHLRSLFTTLAMTLQRCVTREELRDVLRCAKNYLCRLTRRPWQSARDCSDDSASCTVTRRPTASQPKRRLTERTNGLLWSAFIPV